MGGTLPTPSDSLTNTTGSLVNGRLISAVHFSEQRGRGVKLQCIYM